MTKYLTVQQRERLLQSLTEALCRSHPGAALAGGAPLSINHIASHLDDLVFVATHCESDSLQAQLAMTQEVICPVCHFQYPTGYCPLRATQGCSIQRYAAAIFPAIKGELANLQSPAACASPEPLNRHREDDSSLE